MSSGFHLHHIYYYLEQSKFGMFQTLVKFMSSMFQREYSMSIPIWSLLIQHIQRDILPAGEPLQRFFSSLQLLDRVLCFTPTKIMDTQRQASNTLLNVCFILLQNVSSPKNGVPCQFSTEGISPGFKVWRKSRRRSTHETPRLAMSTRTPAVPDDFPHFAAWYLGFVYENTWDSTYSRCKMSIKSCLFLVSIQVLSTHVEFFSH